MTWLKRGGWFKKMGISFKGNVFLIVGASGGIGEELCVRLAKEGATLLLAGRNKEKLEKLRQRIHSGAQTFSVDLTSVSSVRNAVAEAFSTFPTINYVIHAAGYFTPYRFEDIPPEEKKQAYLTNIYGPSIVSEEVLHHWKGTPYFKSILFISSIAGIDTVPKQREVYAFSKRMVIELFRKYYSLFGDSIHFSCFCPGPTETAMWKEVCTSISAYEKISPAEVCRRYEAAGGLILTVKETVDHLLTLLSEEDNGILYAPLLNIREQQSKKVNFEELDQTIRFIEESLSS